jgi:hypothetical protein
MRRTMVVILCALLAMTSLAMAKGTNDKLADMKFRQSIPASANPPEILGASMFQAAAATTTLLGWWQFDNANGTPNEQGWTKVDKTTQITQYFHVDGTACHGITPVAGNKSMWCGQWATTQDPWCGWVALPGYGNGWDQSLVSQVINKTSLQWSWKAVWDSEPGYDFTYAEYYDNAAGSWVALAVNAGAGFYTGAGGPVTETFTVSAPTGSTQLRFHFASDGGWSDEDGLWPTGQGAFKVDDISVTATGFSNGPQTFETAACDAKSSPDGFWSAQMPAGFGLYAALHSAASIVQEDPCLKPVSNLWGFFDSPIVTNYACGGWPLQGALAYGPDAAGLYMYNEIWSPWLANLGSGSNYQIEFLTYRDLPLDNLQFYIWEVRSRGASGCPLTWNSDTFVYFGDQKDWFPELFQIGAFVPAGAVDVQIALGAIDACGFWCGIYGTGACHSHAPLIDQVKFYRLAFAGPQWIVRDIDLFQDNFSENGGITGPARCDMPQDILPGANGGILPGDSLAVEVSDPNGIATDPTVGGPAVYLFVKVTDRSGVLKAAKSGVAIQSPDNTRYPGDPNAGTLRYPYVGAGSAPAGLPAGWSQYRMDRTYVSSGGSQANKYCCDLMDIANSKHLVENQAANVGVFTPGDVVNYFLGAKNTLGQWSYFHRTVGGQGALNITLSLGEASSNAMEWSVLPDAGRQPGDLGDILFVDDADDRGGPAQRYFDWAFQYLGLEDRVDRFDVIGPSSNVGNSLASRVKNVSTQIIGDPVEIYQKILWNSSDLSSGLIGDGGAPNGGSSAEKSDDFGLLYNFLSNHPENPGVYAAGDDMVQDWSTLIGLGAINVKSVYMNHALVNGSHVAAGEPVSPLVTKTVGSPIGPSSMYAFGGCPLINDFDVVQPTGTLAFTAMRYTGATRGAVVAQATPNSAGTTARFVLSGFAYNFIRDDAVGGPPDRVNHLRDILIWFQNPIGEPTGIDPVAFANNLDDNYPNPFNPTTTIKYSIAERGQVQLKIYNAAGQLVRTLINEEQAPVQGGFSKIWNGMNEQGQPVASGVYFYQLTAKNFSQTKKMVLLK